LNDSQTAHEIRENITHLAQIDNILQRKNFPCHPNPFAMQKFYDANGKRRTSFSFSRLITNAVPNFAKSGDPTVSVSDLDTLFYFQQSVKPPQKLISTSLYLAQITQDEKSATKVYDKLLKLGILCEGPPYVDTKKITANFTHQLAIVSSFAQKRLIYLLFDWEEEVRRLQVLEDEEKEIETVIEEVNAVGGEVGHLEKRLLEIGGLKKLKPSLRERRASAVSDQDKPPTYEEAQGAA